MNILFPKNSLCDFPFSTDNFCLVCAVCNDIGMYLVRIIQSEGNSRPNLKEANPNHSARKICYMNTGLQKHVFRITATWRLEKMHKVSTLIFIAEHCTPEQWLLDRMSSYRCVTNHLKSILCTLLPVLDFIDFCNTNSRLPMAPEIKLYILNYLLHAAESFLRS